MPVKSGLGKTGQLPNARVQFCCWQDCPYPYWRFPAAFRKAAIRWMKSNRLNMTSECISELSNTVSRRRRNNGSSKRRESVKRELPETFHATSQSSTATRAEAAAAVGAVGATDTVFAVVSPGEVVEVSLQSDPGWESAVLHRCFGRFKGLRNNQRRQVHES